MPYITRIHIDKCRNVRDLDVDLSVAAENGAGEPAAKFRHLILTGPNGSGKSGVLEAVANSWEELLTRSQQRAPAELTWTPQVGLKPGFEAGEHVAFFRPATRPFSLQGVSGPAALPFGLNLFVSGGTAQYFLQFLVNQQIERLLAAGEGDQASASRLRAWFDRFQQNLQRLFEDDHLTLDFDRRAFGFTLRRSDGYTFGLGELADGHAAALSIFADLLIRIDAVQRARNDFTFIPEGIAIIDEIETHLHLSLQEQILPLLTDFFPTFQFIVATHSPAVIASIPNAVVYDLRTRKQVLSDGFRGVRYGTLMTEHFGISSEIDLDSTEKLLKLRDLVRRATRTPEEQRELEDLTTELMQRSPAMAVEVWMVKEGLSGKLPAAAGERS
jgi:predicted ATPase